MTSAQRWLAGFVLLGALLLFSLEPLVGKLLLPSYGGSFAVWTTCLTWFQGVLFLAYLYCHFLGRRIGLGHLAVLAFPLLWMPIAIGGDVDPESPILSIAWTLTCHIGPPFFALATTSVIAQQWLVQHAPKTNPYPLYAASNLGSFLALLLYPVAIEPLFGLGDQRAGWSVAYGGYLLVAVLAAWRLRAGTSPAPTQSPNAPESEPDAEPEPDAESEPDAEPEPEAKAEPEAAADANPMNDAAPDPVAELDPPERGPAVLHWFLLSAIPSAFLLATTNVITLDIGSFPFVWVLPLAVYLLSFVAVFRERPWCPHWVRRFWLEFSLIGLFFYRLGSIHTGGWITALAIGGYMLVLGAVCLVAHRQLYLMRPPPERLSSFYLTTSLGGWAGGLSVSLLAPLVFTSIAEYPVAIVALALSLLFARLEAFQDWVAEQPKPMLAGSILIMVVVPLYLVLHPKAQAEFRHRNFYGTYAVVDYEVWDFGEVKVPRRRILVHGTTNHGMQLLDEPKTNTSYYGAHSPAQAALRTVASPRQVAVVGLGSGALANQMRPDDDLIYFELDPANERIAREYFTYLDGSPARSLEVIVGDARLRLAEQPAARFDVIVVDAFSSDAIPVHLLTREALALYQDKLAPGGIVVIHISNRFYDLPPPLVATCKELGLEALFGRTDSQEKAVHEIASEWCVIGAEGERRAALREWGFKTAEELMIGPVAVWSDEHVDLLTTIFRKLRLIR